VFNVSVNLAFGLGGRLRLGLPYCNLTDGSKLQHGFRYSRHSRKAIPKYFMLHKTRLHCAGHSVQPLPNHVGLVYFTLIPVIDCLSVGTLMGVTNMIATIPGFLSPSVVGALTHNNVCNSLQAR